jgi:D-alanyl-lipoteichoic acid acyltransferase DltB (MBOAT superfamily)
MSLSSLEFLFGFLPIAVIGTHLLRSWISARAAQVWMVALSLGFYAAAGVSYVPLLLGSAAFNWAIGRGLGSTSLRHTARKRLLVAGLSADVLVLCVVKYTGFFLETLGSIAGTHFAAPRWAFPLGVSFFTLSQVMYLVDCYENLVPPNSALDHLTFVSFFPNVTAGPLERVKHFVSQLGDIGSPNGRNERLARGVALMAMGLFKKVVIADSFAHIANAGWAQVGALSTAGAWLTSLAYTFDLYFDFSGYSDMAFGIARLLGISLVYNFNAPYRSLTISEYWQRWHISLSKFITTYLYTPILRSMGRVDVHKAALAAVLAMTIAGFWHGPAWTFVLWGLLQGSGIATYQYWKRRKRPLPRLLANVVTFAFVNLTMIVFRAPSVGAAFRVARLLLPSQHLMGVSNILGAIAGSPMPTMLPAVAFGTVAAFAGPTSTEIAERLRPSYPAAAGIAVAFAVSFVYIAVAGGGSDFAYRVF